AGSGTASGVGNGGPYHTSSGRKDRNALERPRDGSLLLCECSRTCNGTATNRLIPSGGVSDSLWQPLSRALRCFTLAQIALRRHSPARGTFYWPWAACASLDRL